MLPCLLVFTSLNTGGSNSEFTQQDGRKEKTAKLFGVTSVIRLLLSKLLQVLCALS